jgi:glycosyltransferase involved in cell wall biosynthesis
VLGTRADELPAPVRRVVSLEGRATFTPYELPASLLDPDAAFDPHWRWEFARRGYPRRPVALERRSRPPGPLTVSWIVPPWQIGSGGHTTIFRLVRELERRGHRCSIHLFDPDRSVSLSGGQLRKQIRDHFIPVEAAVFRELDSWIGADVAIATEWRTAFPLRDLPHCGAKAYLVQDHEPEFYATSSESIWAEESYRMGFPCIAYTPWMASLLRERYGVDARYFECGTDTDVYRFAGEEGREPGLIAVYARSETERRAVELAVAGIGNLFERRPGVQVAMFGSLTGIGTPFPCQDLGIRPPRELAALYRRASAGVVFSLTTHSLVAHEMMASGLPVVELEGENVESALGPSGEHVEQAARTPDAIADALERILDDRERAAAMARRARAFVEQRTWERAGDQLEDALREIVASPARDAFEAPSRG